MTTSASPQIVPRPPAAALALRAADQGVASALESVLSDHTRRVYAAQWRLFTGWCDEVGLQLIRRTDSPWPATWQCAPEPPPLTPGRPGDGA